MFQQNRKEPHQSEPQPGEDLEYTVNIGFWDAIRGTKIRLTVFRHEECGACHGAGSVSAGKMICPEWEVVGKSTRRSEQCASA